MAAAAAAMGTCWRPRRQPRGRPRSCRQTRRRCPGCLPPTSVRTKSCAHPQPELAGRQAGCHLTQTAARSSSSLSLASHPTARPPHTSPPSTPCLAFLANVPVAHCHQSIPISKPLPLTLMPLLAFCRSRSARHCCTTRPPLSLFRFALPLPPLVLTAGPLACHPQSPLVRHSCIPQSGARKFTKAYVARHMLQGTHRVEDE